MTSHDNIPHEFRSFTRPANGGESMFDCVAGSGDQRWKTAGDSLSNVGEDHFFNVVCPQSFAAEPDAMEAIDLNVKKARTDKGQSVSIP